MIRAVVYTAGLGSTNHFDDGNGNAPSASVAVKSFPAVPSVEMNCLAGEGEMAGRMRTLDWSQTALGPMEQWPQSLRTSISICLASRFPIVMYWGPEYVVLYNDAYSAILGSKHPWALGQRCRDCWAEIWDTIGPMLNGVVSSAQATWSDDLLLLLQRHGYQEECYFSFSFSPIRIESGEVGGVFTAVMETTDNVVGGRRLRTLRDLAARAVDVRSETEAWRIAADTLAENPYDIPFAVLCHVGSPDHPVDICATAGIESQHALCTSLSMPGSSLSEHVRRVARWREPIELKDDWPRVLPQKGWQAPATSVLLMPVSDLAQERASGVLLAGVSPRKALDEGYRTFFQLVARQIANTVSEARSREEERTRAEALAELDRAKTLFFSNVSHEFRTPLTLMLGPLEDALAARDSLPPEQRERLEVAHRNSLRLLKLVNTLLDFSRIEAGRIEACYQPTDLGTLTTEFASLFQSAIERAGLRFIVNCPSLDEPVYIDHEMWEKVVLNLLSNAFKFTFEGEIEVALRKVQDAVELSVRDTGSGIPPHEISHLFERFYRVKGARGRTFEGSGIGLALVQELVKLHGGTVRVDSRFNGGSTFTVTVPLGKDHLPADRVDAVRTLASTSHHGEAYEQEALHWLPAAPNASEDLRLSALLSPTLPSPDSHREHPARILLADDNADMREYVTRLLKDRYEVVAAVDGQEALEIARRQPPELILADVMMPRLDGFGLLQQIRHDPALKRIPVMLLSARAGDESRIEGLGAGADDYIVKPFSARELLARVASQLKMASLRQEAAEQERKLRAEAELVHQRNQQALQEKERLLRAIIETTPECVKLISADGTLLHMNAAGLAMIGATCAEMVIGKTVYDLLAPEDRERFRQFNEMICQGRSGSLQFEIVTFDGVRRHMDTRAAALRQPDGSYFHLAVTRDVTEQSLADRARALLAAIVDSSDDAIVSKNLDGVITSWNKGAERTFGYTAAEAVGQHITLIIPSDRQEEEAEILARLRRGERIDHIETVRKRKDGELIDISLTISPVKDVQGRVIGASKVARDITLRKRADEALRQSESRFRHLSEHLDSEVKTRTRELEQRTADVERQSQQLRELSWQLLHIQDEERRHLARELHDSAGQILTLLGINLSTLVESARQKTPEVAEMAQKAEELVQEVTREIRTTSYLLHPPLLDENGLPAAIRWYIHGLAQRSGLAVEFEISEQFGRLSRDIELVLFRVVQECLTNVHRHSGSARAFVHLRRDAARAVVEVRDEGKGMSPQRLAEIQSRGSGVGIRGMRERLRQFHGEMTIHSSGSGTVVLVTIPVPNREPGLTSRAAQTPGSVV